MPKDSKQEGYLRLALGYLLPQYKKVIIMAGLMLASVASQLVAPQVLKRFIDVAMAGTNPQEGSRLLSLACIYVVFSLGRQGLTAITRYIGEDIGWISTNMLRSRLVQHCLRLGLEFHKDKTAGEMVERVDGDVNALANFYSRFLVDVAMNVILMLGILAALTLVSPVIGAAITSTSTATVFILLRAQKKAVPKWEESRQSFAELTGYFGEVVSGAEEIKSLGAVDHIISKLTRLMRQRYPIARRANLTGYAMWVIPVTFFALNNVTALALGAWLWHRGLCSIGTVYIIMHYTGMLGEPIGQLRGQLEDLQKAGASITRTQQLLSLEPTVPDTGTSHLPPKALDVVFKEVSFGYDPSEPVLDNVSFKLGKGRIMGLLGRTGSGKTTVSRLLLRLYDVDSGHINISGYQIKDISISNLRKNVGLVTQDVQLMRATVRDNVTFFGDGISDKLIVDVLTEIGLGDWYASLPHGLDSELMPGCLSAGESQLLALARIFLRNPGLVILDEPTSRLDPGTQALVERALMKLANGRTVLIIAHRLSTVQMADDILILDQGHILESGSRLTLIADKDSHFNTLLSSGLEEVLA